MVEPSLTSKVCSSSSY